MRQAEGPRQALWQRRGPHHFVAAVPGLQVGLAGAPDDDGRVLRLLAEAVVHVGHRAVHVRCARRPSGPSVPRNEQRAPPGQVVPPAVSLQLQHARRCSVRHGPALSAAAAAGETHWPVGPPRHAENTTSTVPAAPTSKQEGAVRVKGQRSARGPQRGRRTGPSACRGRQSARTAMSKQLQ